MEVTAESHSTLILLLTEYIAATVLIPTVILGTLFAAVYIFRRCKHNMTVEEATIAHCFLMSAGIIGGFLLATTAALGAIMPQIADIQHKVHELNIYIIIGGVTVIVTFCKQAKNHVFFDIPSNSTVVSQRVLSSVSGVGNDSAEPGSDAGAANRTKPRSKVGSVVGQRAVPDEATSAASSEPSVSGVGNDSAEPGSDAGAANRTKPRSKVGSVVGQRAVPDEATSAASSEP